MRSMATTGGRYRTRAMAGWIDPVDLVAWHPDVWSYGLHLAELTDARRALFIVARRQPDRGVAAAVGFAVLLDDVLGVREIIAQHQYRVPMTVEVRGRMTRIAECVANGTDSLD